MRLISFSDQWPAQYQIDRRTGRGASVMKETKEGKLYQNEVIRSEKTSIIEMNGRRGSRLWSEKGGEVSMEVNRALSDATCLVGSEAWLPYSATRV